MKTRLSCLQGDFFHVMNFSNSEWSVNYTDIFLRNASFFWLPCKQKS